MKKFYFLFSLLSLFIINVHAQTPPKRELRAAWLSTFLNLDWPSTSGRTVQQVKDSVTKLLIMHRQTGINALYVQVRSECDAIYPSSIEPWSSAVTGVQGTPPANGFDPLQFVIDECRRLGIEVHAWLNPYRAVNNFNNIANYAATHVAKIHPEWLLAQGTLRILDPGIPEVRDYVINVVMDIVRRYDVDGIHFDDYFYPYPSAGGTPTPPRFNDNATFAAFPRGFTNQNDWRRDNINLLIQRTYDSIKIIKPWTKFGVSPFGIWRNQSSDATGSATNGLQSYSDVFADSKKWIEQGWVDYLTPQIYWSIGFTVANYSVLVPWWNSNANNRHIYAGHAAYKVNADADANWNNPSQINNQVRLNRSYNQVYGSCFFRTRNFALNPLFFRDSLMQYVYTKPALLPAMPWRDNVSPQPASNLTVSITGNSVQLNWSKSPATTNELDKVRQYVIYRFNTSTINLNDVNAVQYITANDATATYTDADLAPGTYYYVVTALDRFHNESVASNTADATIIATSVLSPDLTALNLKNYPNPFSTSTVISYELVKPMHVTVTLHDANGKELKRLVAEKQPAGKQMITLDAAQLPAGIYYITLKTNTFSRTIKLSAVK